ncbi:MAG: UDP-N-acetylmuramoyl-tripeptide--D-alanyl-D-alanine ligase [Flavobacteriales bacterium]|nr:UDP-N-acetylmuramoyl-tripeptide--D-alanyl-D-alanine ligase [Flavobacteriales bacterium]
MKIEDLYKLYTQSYKVSTDTRSIESGSIFFALKGDNFNGNKFVEKAIETGAAIAVIDEKEYYIKGKTFLTDNVLNFLQKFANYHRKQLKATFIGITGTNGKTTTKELVHQVLSKKYNVLATKGNFNNHIGVPLTLLSIKPEHDMAIIEMGANHRGEIADLCKIAMPEYGYVTNFGKAHLEGFGSFEGIIKTKSELFQYILSTNGTVFVNDEDPIQIERTANNRKSFLSDKIFFEGANPFVAVNNNGLMIKTKLIGNYNFTNIKAAISIGEFFGVSSIKIKDALEEYQPTNNRSQIINKDSNTIILDAYNANPTSMRAAISNLEEMDADYKVAILGDMFELGEFSEDEHLSLAKELEKSAIDEIYLIGKEFSKTKFEKLKYYSSTDDLIKSNIVSSFENTTILIKGSRGMALEKILN